MYESFGWCITRSAAALQGLKFVMKLLQVVFIFYSTYTVSIIMADYGMNGEEVKFVLNFESPLYVCPDEDSRGFIDTGALELVRLNETVSALNGAVNLFKGLETGSMVEIILEKESYGHYERVTTLEICDVCKEIEDPESPYQTMLQLTSFPDKCPFDAGVYTIDNLIADLSDLPVNSGNAGRYTASVHLYRNLDDYCNNHNYNSREIMACFRLDVVVEPL